MTTTRAEIRQWLKTALDAGDISHVIVATDTFDYTDYPVFVRRGESVTRCLTRLQHRQMTEVMECYSLYRDIEAQLAEEIAWHPEG